VQVLHGAFDFFVAVTTSRRLADLLPNSRFAVIIGAAHSAWDNASDYLDKVLSCIAEVEATTNPAAYPQNTDLPKLERIEMERLSQTFHVLAAALPMPQPYLALVMFKLSRSIQNGGMSDGRSTPRASPLMTKSMGLSVRFAADAGHRVLSKIEAAILGTDMQIRSEAERRQIAGDLDSMPEQSDATFMAFSTQDAKRQFISENPDF
jgi:hypothetical protein